MRRNMMEQHQCIVVMILVTYIVVGSFLLLSLYDEINGITKSFLKVSNVGTLIFVTLNTARIRCKKSNNRQIFKGNKHRKTKFHFFSRMLLPTVIIFWFSNSEFIIRHDNLLFVRQSTVCLWKTNKIFYWSAKKKIKKVKQYSAIWYLWLDVDITDLII